MEPASQRVQRTTGHRLMLVLLSACLEVGSQLATAAALVTPPVALTDPSATGECGEARISADGRHVLFTSDAADLIPGDANAVRDVFLRDRLLGTTTLVSRPAGSSTAGNGESARALMTPDARYVVFQSSATNLITEGLPPAGAGRRRLIYRWDRESSEHRLINIHRPVVPGHPFATNELVNVSHDLAPIQLSSDGQRLLLEVGRQDPGLSNPQVDEAPVNAVLLWDADQGTTELLSGHFQTNPPETNITYTLYSGSGVAGGQVMTEDGRFVALSLKVRAPASGVAYGSDALMSVVVRDRVAGTNGLPNYFDNRNGVPLDPGRLTLPQGLDFQLSKALTISANEWLLYEQRRTSFGGSSWVWLINLRSGERFMVSTNAAAGQLASGPSGMGAISQDGNWVAYFSFATTLVAGDDDALADVYLYDRQQRTATVVSKHPQWRGPLTGAFELPPVLTPDGRFALYQATGSGLFRHDRVAGTNVLIATDVASEQADISDDGRFVVFTALPAAFDPTDTRPHRQVFCHDFETGETELISRRDPAVPLGTPDGPTSLELAAVSATGRYVAYTSRAWGFDPRANGGQQLWLRDLQTGGNTLISRDRNGQPLQTAERFRDVQLSADGRWLCFVSNDGQLLHGDTNGLDDVFLFDRQSGFTRLVSFNQEGTAAAAGRSFEASLARDGSQIAFKSTATNIVTGGGTNDLYLHDVAALENRRLSAGFTGGGASGDCRLPMFSADGRTVVFLSLATNLVATPPAAYELQPYLADLDDGSIRFVGGVGPGSPLFPDGAIVPQIAADGGRLLLRRWSYQANLGPDVWLHDVASGGYQLVATNGGTVALAAAANALVVQRPALLPGSPLQLYLRDLDSAEERLISVAWDGVTPGDGHSRVIGFAAQDRYILFRSHAANLGVEDRNESVDLYLHDRSTGFNRLVSRVGAGTAGGFTGRAMITDDGGRIFFESYAGDFVAHDHNRERDIFVLQLQAPDSDRDQLPDDWELAYFDTLDRSGTGDADGDGASDLAEFRAGTAPTNTSSVLRVITLTSLGDGSRRVVWQSVAGKLYQVQFKDEVAAPAWSNLGGELAATSSSTETPDPTPADNRRFYRVIVVE